MQIHGESWTLTLNLIRIAEPPGHRDQASLTGLRSDGEQVTVELDAEQIAAFRAGGDLQPVAQGILDGAPSS